MLFPDLFNVQFWWIVALAMIVLVPLRHAGLRRWTFAAINLLMIALMLKSGVVAVLAMVAVGWLVLRVGGGRFATIATTAAGLAALGLFLVHKRPDLVTSSGVARIEPVLGAIGYSYVVLRWIEMARAVRSGRHPLPDPIATINYLLPFHMLAAGPIQSFDEFRAQPAIPRPLSAAGALRAIERVAFGLFKKYVVAQAIQRAFLTGFHAGGMYTLLEVQLTYIWLYLDFSAYSDIAVGIGRLIGFEAPENFNHPYLARNMVMFWERWHISLSMFIRRNLFIPAQLVMTRYDGGRHPLRIAALAFLVAFVPCGLWHRIGWPWVAWGLYHAAGLTISTAYRQWLTRKLGRKGVLQYMENPWIHLVMSALTFEFAALGVALPLFPYEDIFPWMSSH